MYPSSKTCMLTVALPDLTDDLKEHERRIHSLKRQLNTTVCDYERRLNRQETEARWRYAAHRGIASVDMSFRKKLLKLIRNPRTQHYRDDISLGSKRAALAALRQSTADLRHTKYELTAAQQDQAKLRAAVALRDAKIDALTERCVRLENQNASMRHSITCATCAAVEAAAAVCRHEQQLRAARGTLCAVCESMCRHCKSTKRWR